MSDPRWRASVVMVVASMLFAVSTAIGGQAAFAGRDGRTWSVVPSANDGPMTNVATSISFAGRSDGWLVGGSLQPSPQGTVYRTLAEHWDGATWTLVPTPDPGLDDELTGVVALARDDVWAVGWSAVWTAGGSISVPLIMHWDGGAWTVVQAPDIDADTGTLAGIAACGGHELWAVGSRSASVGSIEETLALHRADGAWERVPTIDPAGRANRLASVTCSGRDVWAVGSSMDVDGGSSASLVEALKPSGGRPTPSPDPWAEWNDLYGVAAHGPNDVWAVGQGSQGAVTGPLALHYDGRTWSAVRAPRAGSSAGFVGVAWSEGHRFWMVGSSGAPGAPWQRAPLIERWTGTGWVRQATPAPHVGGDLLVAVATTPGGGAMAVGDGFAASGFQRTLVLKR